MKLLRAIAVAPALGALLFVLTHAPETVVHAIAVPAAGVAAFRAAQADSAATQPASKSSDAPPTWSRDIAPILYGHCTACHHPDGAGPFSLLTYDDARRWGPQVLTVTQSRFMPPWLPEPGYGDFADVRRLSDHDRDLIQLWVGARMPEGDPPAAPAPPHYDNGWVMGKPDLILKFARAWTLPAGGTDVYRNFILPYPLAQTHYIRAMEIRPGAPQIVHHANITIDRSAAMRRQNAATWQNGIPGMDEYVDAGDTFDPDSHFLFWKPDTPALVEPEGMPWRLDPGNDLILNMHLKPSGKPETIDAEVGLYFTSAPPTKQPMLVALERDDQLDIPAGDANFVIEDSLTLPVDVEVLGVYPHAHYLGHDLKGWAILPSGEKKWLVWIRDWDIDRQSIYRYRGPILLPKGTVLHMRYSYDNSAANVHNPHSPPVRVRAGNRSEDEMGHLWLQLLPVNAPAGGPDPRLLLEEAWMRNRVRKTPDDSISLYNLAAALAGEGKYVEAVADFEHILRLSPNDERTLTALGVALDGEGEWQRAEQSFRAAIAADASACYARFDLASLELRHQEWKNAEADFRAQQVACPEDAETHADLGTTLADEGRNDESAQEFRRALALDGNNVAALIGLGTIETEEGENSEAVMQLAAAVRLAPSSSDAHTALARAYAQAGNVTDALAELRTATHLKPEDPELHSALAQVLASTGNVQEAIAEQRAALKLLEDDPDGWNNLGVLEERTGQKASARADFEHALQLKPDHTQAKANLARLGSIN